MVIRDLMGDYVDKYEEFNRDFSYFSEIAIVKFERDKHGNISGRCRFGLVYRHRDSEPVINEGETWVCELQENPNKVGQYFGKAVEKIGPAFLLDLRKDQIRDIADCIWKNNKESVENMLFEQYGDVIERKVEEICGPKEKELESERKAFLEKEGGYQKTISDLKKKNEDLSEMLDQCDDIIKSLKEERDGFKSKTEGNKDIGPKSEVPPIRIPVAELEEKYPGQYVFRVSEDALYSKSFEDGTYSVHVSSDKRRMLIKQNPGGSVKCEGGMMRLFGLNELMKTSAEKMPYEVVNGTYDVILDIES